MEGCIEVKYERLEEMGFKGASERKVVIQGVVSVKKS